MWETMREKMWENEEEKEKKMWETGGRVFIWGKTKLVIWMVDSFLSPTWH